MIGLDYIAMASGLTGSYLVGRRIRCGWIFYGVCSAMVSYIGYSHEMYGMCIGGLLYLGLEVKGWIAYGKKNSV